MLFFFKSLLNPCVSNKDLKHGPSVKVLQIHFANYSGLSDKKAQTAPSPVNCFCVIENLYWS